MGYVTSSFPNFSNRNMISVHIASKKEIKNNSYESQLIAN